MNRKEEIYFEALSKDRSESADILNKPSMRGIRNSVVEKYSDQAHFIYELLQNADDAFATNARFILESNRLIFAHNGSRHFSVSDPKNEDSDSDEGRLGDINAITSIANSNKTEASIGKFGVGFKAVFQYTSTPHIYDPDFRFRIDDFIVPILLENDFPGRRKDETLFVFPFDHSERDAEEAYSDISDKLRNLSFPLLFLTGLKSIEFHFGNVIGLYGKEIKETCRYADITAEHVCLTQNAGGEFYDEDLWLFSRLDECGHRYSVGFFMDKNGQLRPVNEPAFCFFPTKEVTGLSFVLHAPFLLTDSREGIRAGVPHNDRMISCLSNLAADALVHLRDLGEEKASRLIDDHIVDIIPVNPEIFSNPVDKSKVSFLPFYQAIKAKFEKEALLPSTEGYVASSDAYWAAVPQLPQLFSNEQLSKITNNKNAHWVFVSFGRDETQRTDKALFSFVDSLVRTNLNEDAIINGRGSSYFSHGERKTLNLKTVKGISAAFIKSQPISWLHDLYKWLSETKNRTELAKNKPIFLDQNGDAVTAFDKKGQLILFLPVKGIDTSGYTVVHPELLRNPDTKEFIETIGVKQPSLRDQIYNIILPQYRSNEAFDTDPHFELFFKYYCECSNDEIEDFIDLIRECEFLTYYDAGDQQTYRGAASSMYLSTPELRAFFETKGDVCFIALDEYKKLVGKAKEKQLISFLTQLGIKKEVAVVDVEIDYHSTDRTDLPTPYSTHPMTYTETVIDGCKEIVEYIVANKDKTKSVILWNCLLEVIETKCNNWHTRTLSMLLSGTCRYFYYSSKTESFISSDAIWLRQSAWIYNTDGEFVTPDLMTRDTLSDIYDTDSEYADDLLDFLNIPYTEEMEEDEDDSNLTDAQREKIKLADMVKKYGIEDEADLEEFREFKRQKEANRGAEELAGTSEAFGFLGDGIDEDDDFEKVFNDENEYDESGIEIGTSAPSAPSEKRRLNKITTNVVKDIIRRTKESLSSLTATSRGKEEDFEDADQDELIPSTVDYSKRIEQAKQKSAAEIDRIAYFEELQNRAINVKKYSFTWFKTLLELESINSGEANANSKEVSISFSVVEREPGTKRTLVLKQPNRYIPQFMEDLADIPLILHMADQTKTVAIEVANIKSYTLRVKMKNSEDIDGIDLSSVTAATIDAKSPAFLLEELRKQFAELELEDEFDMQQNLCRNIEFVFGPPGTGKTTHLAKNILIPLIKENDECKVLVLTPTNKSADVLVRRIMEMSGMDHAYEDWLVRFGATGDEDIEQSPVFRDKTFDIRTLSKNVTITTIARFPYDFFMPKGARIFLNGINWDYIVIDEASMIPIANIVYPLYKKTPQKFIIAGDPFQIEPITSVDLWKNENIYTMVHLDSFVNPKTIPCQYKVELLTTQYRSIPDIGGIFSNFAYGGILKHHRSADSQRPLNVGNDLGVETLNIIKFPVSKYESIYRAKRLQHSSAYQVYSALFIFEYVNYLSRAIAENNSGSLFKIGVIAPYRAQSDMIDKLLASEKFPKEIDVQVGTIHSFQGDECDIIFAVFNTPPTISASKEMFLNKRNIINVSISRARDYLFIVMPDDNTEKVENLRLVKRVEQLIRSTDAWNEFLTPDLEDMMFGDSQYLENNAFSTSHQSVNVYGLPEKCYEVRTEDTAVDVQIHKSAPRIVAKQSMQIITESAARPESIKVSDTEGIVDAQPTETKVTEHSSEVLEKNPVPRELQRVAIEVQVIGTRAGSYYLVPYKGKLKNYTIKKLTAMFIPQMRSGREKLISVSVIEEDNVIFITKENFKMYEKGLTDPEGFELRKTYFG